MPENEVKKPKGLVVAMGDNFVEHCTCGKFVNSSFHINGTTPTLVITYKSCEECAEIK